jgi:hypothetical protein
MQPFPRIQTRRFWNYTCTLESAEILQVEDLRLEVWGRLKAILNHQVHTEDVMSLYMMTDKDHPMRKMVGESIGKALLEHRLLAKPVYTNLRKDITFKDFDDDVNEAIARMKAEYAETDEGKAALAARHEAIVAARQEARKRYQHRYGRTKNTRATATTNVARQHTAPAPSVPTPPVAPFNLANSTVVRKGRKGRGRYAAVPLNQVGVTSDNYRRHAEPAPRPHQYTGTKAKIRSTSARRTSTGGTSATTPMTSIPSETPGASTTATSSITSPLPAVDVQGLAEEVEKMTVNK